MNFANRLKKTRIEKGFTQKDIYSRLSISQNGYASWEQGRTEPNLNSLIKLSDIFQISVDYLLGIENEEGIVVIQNELNEDENYFIDLIRRLNSEKKQELISYANYLANKDKKQINSQNMLDISDLSDLEKAEVIGFINGFKKQSFTNQNKITN